MEREGGVYWRLPEDEQLRIRATTGRPARGVEVRVVDEARRPRASGEAGDIEVRGPIVMRGYLDDEAATARATASAPLR